MARSLTLDAHAHIDPGRTRSETRAAGYVLAATLSADEAERGLARGDARIAWGVGCHPRRARAIAAFDRDRFSALARRAPLIGEVGLDATSRVPRDEQLRVFRQVLAVARELRRPVSVHPHRTSREVIDELRRARRPFAILHWWSGNADETRDAVALGCYFSVHRAVARRLVWRAVPRDRLLVESDIGYREAPRTIPARIAQTESLLAARLGVPSREIRAGAWAALADIVAASDGRWPPAFRRS